MKNKHHAIPKQLTIDRVRKCEKFKNAADEEALAVIHSLERLSLILFEHWKSHEKAHEPENQHQEHASYKISSKKNHKLGGTCDDFVVPTGIEPASKV